MSAKSKKDILNAAKNYMDDAKILASVGAALAKEGAGAVIKKAKEMPSKVRDKSKDAQIAVLDHIDKKRNKKLVEAKKMAFEDGMRAGKVKAVGEIQKHVNYYFAVTALSYYFARCDGNISKEEEREIHNDIDAILKNMDYPEAIRNKLFEIATKEDISFDEVKLYLDEVSPETLEKLSNDMYEIINADGVLTAEEQAAEAEFMEYLRERREKNEAEKRI